MSKFLDTSLSPKLLAEIADGKPLEIHKSVATNPDTPDAVFAKLGKAPVDKCLSKELTKLIKDKDS